MSVEEALAELQHILGKGLHPTAVSKVREILIKVRADDTQGDKSLPRADAPKDTRG